MSHQTEYDLRMRSYKSITDAHLIPRTPVIIQIDGRAFHTFTRGFKKPFDQVLMAAMRYTAEYLCRNIQGCVLDYTQSDEINLLLIDYEKLETSPWFDNRVQKLASIAASMATNYFNQKFKELVKIKVHRKIEGIIKSATISRNGSGKYFISLLCETDIQELPKTNSSVGIDLGIKDMAILSTGEKIENLKFRKQLEDKLKREQRKLSKRLLIAKKENRKLSEAKNYQKQRIKIAKIHEKIMNMRTDFLNKLSTDIIKNHDIICIEDLNTKGLLHNHKLAKSMSDVSWASFVNKLEYKAKWYGKEIIKIDKFYPSSQICSVCGYKDGKKTFDVREWTCSVCHTHHDRDINAAKNILTEGLRIKQAV